MKRASLGSVPSGSDLASFRRAVSKLKSKGLIPPNKRGRVVNSRTARPGDMYQGKPLREYVRDKANQQVIKGEAVVLPRSRVKDTQGFKVAKPKGLTEKVIVPVPKDARVSTEKGNIVIRHESETGTVKRLLIPRKNLRQYLLDAEKLPDLHGDKWYAFYFYGNRSHKTFRTAEQLLEYLTAYDALEKESRNAQNFRNLEIVQITNKPEWEREVEAAIERRRKHRSHAGTRRSKKAMLARMPEYKKEIYRAKNAAYMREYRKRKGK